MRLRRIKPQQVIDRTLDILEERGWIQGKWDGGPTGGHCVEGAVNAALDESIFICRVMRKKTLREQVFGAVTAVLDAEGIVRYQWASFGPIPAWNDHFRTTYEDVKQVLTKAKDRAMAGV